MQSLLKVSSRYSRTRQALSVGKVALLCASLFQAACSVVGSKGVETVAGIQDRPEPVAPKVRQITIAAVGDVMLGTDYPVDRLPADPRSILSPVSQILQSADITFGNLEGVLMDGGEAVKQCSNNNRCYVFRSPESYAAVLAEAGFNLMSLANNHARDFGEAGRERTMQALDRVGIRHSGRIGDVASWEQHGLKIAMVAFAPFGGSHDMLDMAAGQALIEALGAEHDLLIVSVHGGAEGAEATKLPFATESFHGENRGDVVAFAHMAVDAGADLVLGHGPHVPRAIERYRGRLIAYSLGNFATYQGINVNGTNGLAPILLATLSADGDFVSGRIVSHRQQRPAGPLPDSKHQAARLIQRLTSTDLPTGSLTIDNEGVITILTSPAVAASLGASP